MQRFWHGHASAASWREALQAAQRQLEAQRTGGRKAPAPTLGWVYFTDHFASHAGELLDALRQRWPGVAWTGAVGVGVCSTGTEYFDQPGLVLMLAALPPQAFQVFSGVQPLTLAAPHSALVHADPNTPDIAELVQEMSERTDSGYLFGGLAASRAEVVHLADGVWQGGLSGVAFTRDVPLLSRVTQGCRPVGPVRRVTKAERNVVAELDGEPALDALLEDIEVDLDLPRRAVAKLRATLAGVSDPRDAPLAHQGQFGDDVRVRHLVGVDPGERTVAIADVVEAGMQLAFCQRDAGAARRDLVRICSEIREEAGEARLAGALYFSCAGRGGPHFGAPSAELQIVQHALGDVPLAGFFAGGEIGHRHVYGYTGVLTVFTQAE